MKSCALNDGLSLSLSPNADCVYMCVYSVVVKGKRTAEVLLKVRTTATGLFDTCYTL